jgi:hypothetical protein
MWDALGSTPVLKQNKTKQGNVQGKISCGDYRVGAMQIK